MTENNASQIPAGQVQVKISDEVLKGTYANMAQVGHTQEEFVIDFMNILPPTGILASRIIMSPSHFKRVLAAMQENLKQYESQNGLINVSVTPDHKIGFKTE
jgi:hypothetical protein